VRELRLRRAYANGFGGIANEFGAIANGFGAIDNDLEVSDDLRQKPRVQRLKTTGVLSRGSK
jgi:hypothetical protein